MRKEEKPNEQINKEENEIDIEKNERDIEEFEELKSGGFFSFDKMITPSIIEFIFTFGLVLILLAGGLMFVGGAMSSQSEMNSYLLIEGILLIILGPLALRIACEVLIVLFKIHENLNDIRMKQYKIEK